MTTSRSIARASARCNHRPTMRNIRNLQGRVYVASPLSTYSTPCYDTMLDRLRELLPDAELLPARDLFTSNADWRAAWPKLLPTLSAVVFFDDDEGYIGAGTEREIADARLVGIPVFFLPRAPFDELRHCDDTGGVEFWPVAGRGMWQTTRVCAAIPATTALSILRPAAKGGA